MRTAACPFRSLADVKRANAEHGHYWFSAATMSFFDSELHGPLYPRETVDENGGVAYFAHSRQFTGSDGKSSPRTYHVAVVAADGSINPRGINPSPFPDGYPELAHAFARIAELLTAEQTS